MSSLSEAHQKTLSYMHLLRDRAEAMRNGTVQIGDPFDTTLDVAKWCRWMKDDEIDVFTGVMALDAGMAHGNITLSAGKGGKRSRAKAWVAEDRAIVDAMQPFFNPAYTALFSSTTGTLVRRLAIERMRRHEAANNDNSAADGGGEGA